MKPANNTIQVELHVPDFEKVKEFYGKLGFKVVWERKPEEKKGYLVIKRDNNILCFCLETKMLVNNLILKTSPLIQKEDLV